VILQITLYNKFVVSKYAIIGLLVILISFTALAYAEHVHSNKILANDKLDFYDKVTIDSKTTDKINVSDSTNFIVDRHH
jgi:uncharacterized membrane protein YobD (UPF0266 family)